jgi:hypothetical protein
MAWVSVVNSGRREFWLSPCRAEAVFKEAPQPPAVALRLYGPGAVRPSLLMAGNGPQFGSIVSRPKLIFSGGQLQKLNRPLIDKAPNVILVALIASSCLFSQGFAQSAPPSSPLPTIIKAFSGHWKLSVKFAPASGFPAGTEGTGEETWRPAVAGKTLLSEASWKAGPLELSLLGILWWDGKDNQLHAMDCNNQGTSVCDPKDAAESVAVKWDGTELTVDEPERSPDGKLVTSRVTFKDIKADSFTEVGSLETSPGKFQTMSTILASRSGS